MPIPRHPEQEAREWQQAQELAEVERQRDAYFDRMTDPLFPIRQRLDQLEAENQTLRQRLAALELKAQRGPDDW